MFYYFQQNNSDGNFIINDLVHFDLDFSDAGVIAYIHYQDETLKKVKA